MAEFKIGDVVSHDGKEWEVKAVSVVAPDGNTVVQKHTLVSQDGSVKQYVAAEDLELVEAAAPSKSETAPDAGVLEAAASEQAGAEEVKTEEETPEEESTETPEEEVKEEEAPAQEEAPAEEEKPAEGEEVKE